MVWLKLSVLAFVASLCDSVAVESSESYLVYAVEKKGSVTLYLTNLNLKHRKTLVRLENVTIDKMYLSKDEYGLNVYWSYKDSSNIGRYEVSRERSEMRSFDNENVVFLGVGYNGKIYLYSSNSESISVYDYESANKISESSALEHSKTDMHCVDVDPRDRKQLFFAECSDNKYTGRIYDTSEKAILDDYKQDLPKCFDTWKITPNGKRTYAVQGKEVYMSPAEGEPFTETYMADEDIVGFAAGNDEFFYSNKEKYQMSTIFKATPHGKGYQTSNFRVEGSVKLLALYTPPNQYLIYAAENGDFLKFVKADLDFKKQQTLLNINTNGETLDTLCSGYSNGEHVIYWSYLHSNFLGRLNVTNGQSNQTNLTQRLGTLLGAGNNDKTYFYRSASKSLIVYNFRTKQTELQPEVLPANTDMHCVDVDPRNRDQVFFAECTEADNFGKVLDVQERKVLEGYNRKLPVCFNTWRITPNSKKAYAVFENKIYLSPKNGAPFDLYTWTDDEIYAFAVGNNELFYTTSDIGKIFKLTSGDLEGEFFTTEFNVDEDVKGLVLHQE